MYAEEIMQERDLLTILLAEQKRVVSDYAAAVTESNSRVVREMFETLLSESLAIQADLNSLMRRHQLTAPPAQAERKGIEQQLCQFSRTFRLTDQLFGRCMPNKRHASS